MQFTIPHSLDLLQECFPDADPNVQVGLIRNEEGMSVSIADNESFIWTQAQTANIPIGFPSVLLDDFPRQELSRLANPKLQINKGTCSLTTDGDTIVLPISEHAPRLPHLSNYHVSPIPELEHFDLLDGKVDLIIANAKGSFSAAGRAIAALSYVEGCYPHQISDRDNCFVDYKVFERASNLAQAPNFSVHTAGLALLGQDWMVLCRRSAQDTAYDPVTLLDSTKQSSFPVKITTANLDPSTLALSEIPDNVNGYIIGGQQLTIKARLPSGNDFSLQLKILNPSDIRHFSFKASLKRFLNAITTFGECSIYPPRDLFTPVAIQRSTSWLWIMPAI